MAVNEGGLNITRPDSTGDETNGTGGNLDKGKKNLNVW